MSSRFVQSSSFCRCLPTYVRLLFASALVACSSHLHAEEPPPPPLALPPASIVDAWIHELGANDFHQREVAERQLRIWSADLVDALQPYCDHEDLELRARARRLWHEGQATRALRIPPGWELAWSLNRTTIPTFCHTEPWVVEDQLLVREQRVLKAFDVRLGKQLWETTEFAAANNITPCHAGNEAFYVLFNGKLRCLEPESGKVRWQTTLTQHPTQWQMVGSYIVGGQGNWVFGVDALTGELKFQQKLPDSPRLFYANTELLTGIPAGRNELVFYGLEAGELLRRQPIPALSAPTAIVHHEADRLIVVDSGANQLRSVNTATGSIAWSATLPMRKGGLVPPSEFMFTADAERLYCHGHAWDLETGNLVWRYTLPHVRIRSLRFADYVNGQQRQYLAPPRLADGLIYYPTLSGELHALDATTGAVRWIWQVDPTGQAFRPARAGDYLVAAGQTQLICLRMSRPDLALPAAQ